MCPRVTFARPRCVLRQAQDALSSPKGGHMESTSATHALQLIAIAVSRLSLHLRLQPVPDSVEPDGHVVLLELEHPGQLID